MPLIVWGVGGLLALAGIGYAADKVGEAAEGTASLAKWGAVAGGVYVAYKVAQGRGLIK